MTREEFIKQALGMGMSPRDANKKSNYERFLRFQETGKIPPARGRPAVMKVRQNVDDPKGEIYGH